MVTVISKNGKKAEKSNVSFSQALQDLLVQECRLNWMNETTAVFDYELSIACIIVVDHGDE